jgi:hypothetical protein
MTQTPSILEQIDATTQYARTSRRLYATRLFQYGLGFAVTVSFIVAARQNDGWEIANVVGCTFAAMFVIRLGLRLRLEYQARLLNRVFDTELNEAAVRLCAIYPGSYDLDKQRKIRLRLLRRALDAPAPTPLAFTVFMDWTKALDNHEQLVKEQPQ